MDQFFAALMAELNRIGITDVSYPYQGCNYLMVQGCYFRADYARGRKSIKFNPADEDRPWMFRPDYRGQFNGKAAAKAAELVVQALPDKLKALRERQAEQKHRDEAQTINRPLQHTTCLSVYSTGSEFALQFKHPDRATIMAAADQLQEWGFCSDAPPVMNEEAYGESQEQRTVNIIGKLLDGLPANVRHDTIELMYERYCSGITDPTDEDSTD